MAYRKISFTRYALGGVIVAAPAIILEQSGNERWAWAYVTLVLLGLFVFYSDGIGRAASFTSAQLKKR